MPVDLVSVLPDSAIVLDAHASDWRDAVRLAGDALVESGSTGDEYTGQMLAAIDTLGPYIVIAPGIAIAHSRPSAAVVRSGLSWVRLASPVEFGHKLNDPVRLVIGLAARDHNDHLEVMSAIAAALANAEVSEELASASTPDAVRHLLASATVRQS